MRLSHDQLFEITHRKRPRQQAAWFLEYLGAVIPFDRDGPILTTATYEAVLAKCLGVGQVSNENAPERRGVLRLRKPKHNDQ
jgi:hypothetical protein